MSHLYLAVIHIVGACGGLLAKRLKVPAGWMIGAMGAVLVCNAVFNLSAGYPPGIRTVVQVCSGAIIGSRFSRSDMAELKQVLNPAWMLVIMLFGFNILFATLIATSSPNLSMITSLFASAPGGVSDLALIAADFGADTEQVTLIQLFRFIFVVSFFPPLMKRKYLKGRDLAPPPEKAKTAPLSLAQKTGRAVFSLAVATAGGYLLRGIGVPAGAIIGAIVATTVTNVATEKIYLPKTLRTVVQVSCGCYIGNQVTRHALLSVGSLVVPMILVVLEVLCMAFITAYIIHRITKLELVTCLFSSIPGGITEMGLIADEMKLDTPKIVVMHTCRVVSVICVMPFVVRLFA